MTNVPHCLSHLNIWSPVGTGVGGSLGGVAWVEEVWYKGRI